MKKKSTAIRMSRGDRVFVAINAALLILFFLITLYPMIYVLSASVSTPDAVGSGKMILLPIGFNLKGYQAVFQYKEIWTGYANTLLYTVAGTAVNLAVTLPCAYALSRHDMKGRGILMTFFLITMYVGGGLVPSYINVQSLGLLYTRTIMIINGAISVYNMIVARTFFSSSIPWELHEAAMLDGCGDGRTFFKIVLPLSKPIIVVLMLYYGVGHWNEYFGAMIYLGTERIKYPLQLVLREILMKSSFASQIGEGSLSVEEVKQMLQQRDTANRMKYATIVLATLPMLMLYPWCQRFFAKGVMIGSVKG